MIEFVKFKESAWVSHEAADFRVISQGVCVTRAIKKFVRHCQASFEKCQEFGLECWFEFDISVMPLSGIPTF